MAGAPTKYNKRIHQRLVELIRGCNYISTACAACRIDNKTYYNWESRAKLYESYIDSVNNKHDKIPPEIACNEVYFHLFQDIKAADAEAEAMALKTITDAMPKNWAAAATMMSRRWKERWRDDTGLAQDSIKLGLQIMERLTSALERPGTQTTIEQVHDVPALPSPR